MDEENNNELIEFDLLECSFSNLTVPPSSQDFGDNVKNKINPEKHIQIKIMSVPNGKDIKELGKSESFLPYEIYHKYKIWLISHRIEIEINNPELELLSFGYEAEFEEKKMQTINIAPAGDLTTTEKESVNCISDLSYEGVLSKTIAENPSSYEIQLDKDINIKLLNDSELLGRIFLPSVTNLIQTNGIGKSRCEWMFTLQHKMNKISQSMLNTALVRKFSEEIKVKIRVYVLIKNGWTAIPTMFKTEWKDLICKKKEL